MSRPTTALALSLWLLGGCGGSILATGDAGVPDGGSPDGGGALTPGGTGVVAYNKGLNLRSGPGTSYAVIGVLPCAAQVVLGSGPENGFWPVTYGGLSGWASGTYLVTPGQFDAAVCAP
jgi:uncharacterized protein YgiM (DUF1202 family)